MGAPNGQPFLHFPCSITECRLSWKIMTLDKVSLNLAVTKEVYTWKLSANCIPHSQKQICPWRGTQVVHLCVYYRLRIHEFIKESTANKRQRFGTKSFVTQNPCLPPIHACFPNILSNQLSESPWEIPVRISFNGHRWDPGIPPSV